MSDSWDAPVSYISKIVYQKLYNQFLMMYAEVKM